MVCISYFFIFVPVMIEYIRGELAELSPATAVIDCNGVGYAANISLNTYSAIQGKKSCKLYIYEAIREDAYVLYGLSLIHISEPTRPY